MDIAFETKTRERAYWIWLAEGMRDGDAERHWLNAEEIVRKETGMPVVAAAATAKAAAKPKAAKKDVVAPVKAKTVVATKATKPARTSKAVMSKAEPEASAKAGSPRRRKPSGADVAQAIA